MMDTDSFVSLLGWDTRGVARHGLALTLLTGSLACGGSTRSTSEILRSAPELAVFPSDYDVVTGIDLAQWQETAAASVLARHFARAEPAGFAALERDCRAMMASGVVWAGVRLAGDDPNDVLLRIAGASRDAVVPCIERVVTVDDRPQSVTRNGSLDTIEYGSDSKVYLSWTDATTVLIGDSPEFLRKRRGASEGLDGNGRMVAQWHEVDRSSVFWGVVALGDSAVRELGVDVEAGHWSVARDEGLLLKAAMTFGDTDAGRRAQASLEADAKTDDTPGLRITFTGRKLELHYSMGRAQLAEIVEELDEVLDWRTLTDAMGHRPPQEDSEPDPRAPSATGLPIESVAFEPRFETDRFDDISLPITIELRVLSDMDHVAPQLQVIATCDGATDDEDAFHMELNGAKAGALLRDDPELFGVRSFETPPRQCEFRVQLQETATAPIYYCMRAGTTTQGRCAGKTP